MILLTIFMVTLISIFRRRQQSDSIFSTIGRGLLYVSSVISGRSGNGANEIFFIRLFILVRLSVGVWILMSGVVIAFFTTLLTSYLTVPKLKPIVNSFHELRASNRYKLVEPLDIDLAELFLVCYLIAFLEINKFFNHFHLNQNAETEPYKSLGESLRNQKPSLTFGNLTEKLYDVLLELNGAYASVTNLLEKFKLN